MTLRESAEESDCVNNPICRLQLLVNVCDQVSLMDRAGRRPLLLYPMAAMVVVLAVVTAAIKYQVQSSNLALTVSETAILKARSSGKTQT